MIYAANMHKRKTNLPQLLRGITCGELHVVDSVFMHADEVSGRMQWLNEFDVVFLLVRVRMKGTW